MISGYCCALSADKIQEFVVDGTALPDLAFDIGESYAGSTILSSLFTSCGNNQRDLTSAHSRTSANLISGQ